MDNSSDHEISPRLAFHQWLKATADLINSLIPLARLETALFVLGLAVYLITRLWKLDSFPIYFFGDEAVQALFSEDLLKHGFHGPDGTFFPVYVEAASLRWTPLISMYIHAITLSAFGKSIFVTRATSAVIGILAGVSVALILKLVFQARSWWAGGLLVSLIPAWFLHSRTAFETVMMTAFYGCFLLFYLLYLVRSPRYLYAAILFATLTFYSYSNAQLIVVAAALMLFFSDLRVHLRNRYVLARGALLVLVLAIPAALFRFKHPQAITEHLRMVNTYWMQPLSLQQKMLIYIQKYAYGLDPRYWFFPNAHDLPRHRMLGIAHIPTILLPFMVLGILICLIRARSSSYRAVLIAALATPVGAALVDIGIARVLAFVVPACVIIGLGVDWVIEKLSRKAPYTLWAGLLLVGLVGANFALLRTALVDGPLWFRDYGLYGMQYGAKQIFAELIPAYLNKDAESQILVSSAWANGTDNFLRFFLSTEDQRRVRMDGVESYLFKKRPLNDHDIFIMTPAEYQMAVASPKFSRIKVEQIIPYPDQSPGFYVARLAYSPTADALFAAEKEARRALVESQVTIGDQVVRLRYSQIDMGAPQLIFDGDDFTLMRGLEANPFILEIYFSHPRPLTGLALTFGMVNIDLKASLYAESGDQPEVYRASYRKDSGLPDLEMKFNSPPDRVAWLRLEILNPDAGESANIHIRELKLLP